MPPKKSAVGTAQEWLERAKGSNAARNIQGSLLSLASAWSKQGSLPQSTREFYRTLLRIGARETVRRISRPRGGGAPPRGSPEDQQKPDIPRPFVIKPPLETRNLTPLAGCAVI